MAKIDKSRFTKTEWRKIREQRRLDKQRNSSSIQKVLTSTKKYAFVLGNGVSRSGISIDSLRELGKVYACNAVYRYNEPDYLVAVDVKMVSEITRSGYQNTHEVWTNPNKSFAKIQNLNFFRPSKGWSSGPTALWLASQHYYENIFILGFDYKGIDDGKKFNNVFADTVNYKKSRDGATFFGNWLRQTAAVVKEHPKIQFTRIIQSDNYCPEELHRFDNFKTVFREDFEKIFNLK